jgi:hypothetical protein
MLKIQQDQIDRMRQGRREQFASKIAEYIARELPDVRASLGEPGLLAAVQAGVTRAVAYLFETHRDVALYVIMTFLTGVDMDKDPLLPWVHTLLTNEKLSPSDRVMALSQRSLLFLDAVRGPQNEHLLASLRRFVTLPLEKLLPEPSGDPEVYVQIRLWETYPQHCAIAGETSVERLSELAVRTAGEVALPVHRGAALTGGLMLYLGCGFAGDLWHPWAIEACHGLNAVPYNERVQQLHSAIVRHVREGNTRG